MAAAKQRQQNVYDGIGMGIGGGGQRRAGEDHGDTAEVHDNSHILVRKMEAAHADGSPCYFIGIVYHFRAAVCNSCQGLIAHIFAYICASFAQEADSGRYWGENWFLHKAGAGGEVARRGRCGRMIKSFRAPDFTWPQPQKSDQKVCLKPKVSRLPARYGLWLSIVCTARSRGFFFIVRSKDRLCVCAAAADLATVEAGASMERRGGVLI